MKPPTPGKQRPPLVILIRHGQTTHNKLGLFTGWEDAPLSPEGRVKLKSWCSTRGPRRRGRRGLHVVADARHHDGVAGPGAARLALGVDPQVVAAERTHVRRFDGSVEEDDRPAARGSAVPQVAARLCGKTAAGVAPSLRSTLATTSGTSNACTTYLLV